LICLLFGACSLSAQDKQLIDSLYRAFHAERDPHEKIELLYQIADEVEDTGKPEEVVRYADSLELLSKAARYAKGFARSEEIRGRVHERKGEHALALPYFQRQLAILMPLDDPEGRARALTSIGSM
jgi:hypothetical protein